MVILQEFDLEIQPMKSVRGQGLSKMIVDNQIEDEKKSKLDGETDMEDQKKIVISQVDIDQGVITDVWYQDIV